MRVPAHHHNLHFPLVLHLKQLQPPHQRAKGERKRKIIIDRLRSESTTNLLQRLIKGRKRRKRKRSKESSMVSRDNISPLHEKLHLLRSITHSHAVNETSIIMDASKYIEELKEKVEILNQDIRTSSHSSNTQDSLPTVTVETLEKGFLIHITSGKSCPGLLVSVLEAFEHLNLNVAEATASCTDTFQLQAISSTDHGEEQGRENVNAQVVRQAVLRAIKHWSRSTREQNH